MQYINIKNQGRVLMPKQAEVKINSLTDRNLIIAYLNERNKVSVPEVVRKTSGFNKLIGSSKEEISHFDWQIYYLHAMEVRGIITGNENLIKLDYALSKRVNYNQINFEE